MYNGWNTHIFQILRGEHDGKFISNEIFWLYFQNLLNYDTNFKYQDPEFNSRLFDDWGKRAFEVPPELTKKDNKLVPDAPD